MSVKPLNSGSGVRIRPVRTLAITMLYVSDVSSFFFQGGGWGGVAWWSVSQLSSACASHVKSVQKKKQSTTEKKEKKIEKYSWKNRRIVWHFESISWAFIMA